MKKKLQFNSDKKVLNLLICIIAWFNVSNAQTKSIILGRPTNNSVTASLLFNQSVQYYISYGTTSGVYTNTTVIYTNTANTPDEIDLINLTAGTQYFYQLKYKLTSASVYTSTPEYSFHTQRIIGDEFTFTLEADEHLYDKKGVANMYKVCLQNQLNDKPDFMMSLGDIFGDDHNALTITSHELDSLHCAYRSFLGNICHSVPFYVCLGNHEGENDYYYNLNPGNNLCVWGTQWRKYYYPNPYPNAFYSGNTDNEPFGIGNPENYYSWQWGNALFVVLDVYRDQCDTSDKPTGWNWSLGLPQYTWLKNTLEGSNAQFKFVFAHHIRGQGRGGILNAQLDEWGGYQNSSLTNYTFPTHRPGWAKPIHKLFIDNGVNIFFQGHDHVFAHEQLNGVTYQAVPMPSDSTYQIGFLANASAYVSDTLDGTGHIRVKVSQNCVKVDYIRAYLPADTLNGLHHNGEVAFSYTVGSCLSTGLNNQNADDLIKVFPNPVSNKLIINSTENITNSNFILRNALGQTVMQTISKEIDVSQIANGIYFLNLDNERIHLNKKIIINH